MGRKYLTLEYIKRTFFICGKVILVAVGTVSGFVASSSMVALLSAPVAYLSPSSTVLLGVAKLPAVVAAHWLGDEDFYQFPVPV